MHKNTSLITGCVLFPVASYERGNSVFTTGRKKFSLDWDLIDLPRGKARSQLASTGSVFLVRLRTYIVQTDAKINDTGFKGLEVCAVRKQLLWGPHGTARFACEICRFGGLIAWGLVSLQICRPISRREVLAVVLPVGELVGSASTLWIPGFVQMIQLETVSDDGAF